MDDKQFTELKRYIMEMNGSTSKEIAKMEIRFEEKLDKIQVDILTILERLDEMNND